MVALKRIYVCVLRMHILHGCILICLRVDRVPVCRTIAYAWIVCLYARLCVCVCVCAHVPACG
jgi:hypothetical protein